MLQTGNNIFDTDHDGKVIGTLLDDAPAGIRNDGRLVITPLIARQILDMFRYSSNRKISQPHVRLLAYDMAQGSWLPGSQLAFCKLPNGRLVLVNGNHRMHAVILANTAIEFQICVNAVGSEDEINAAYFRHDFAVRSRSIETLAASAQLADGLGVSKEHASAAVKAAVFVHSGLKFITGVNQSPEIRSADGKITAVLGWKGEIQEYGRIIEIADRDLRRRLRAQGVFGCALVTLRYQPQKATAFWAGVAESGSTPAKDPRRTLNVHLSRAQVQTITEYSLVTAMAWNAWYRRSHLELVRASKNSVFKLLGTPFAKGN